MSVKYYYITIFYLYCFYSGNSNSEELYKLPPPSIALNIINTINHDPKTYTQGLFYDGDARFESSGLFGQSFIRRFDKNGKKTQKISPRYFAEGLTVIDDTLYLLTWKAQTLLLFDKNIVMAN